MQVSYIPRKYLIRISALNVKRNEWNRVAGDIEEEFEAYGMRNICCWGKDWLFLFSWSGINVTKSNPIYRVGIQNSRRDRSALLNLGYSLFEKYPTLNSAFLRRS